MIEKNWPEDGYVVHCDECSADYEPAEHLDWHGAWAAAKDEGWRARTDGSGQWRHYCPEHATPRRAA